MNQWNSAVINTVPAANALRRVEGFNPLKFLRKIRGAGGEVYKLELPYQRLWFRLACPNGRIELNRLRITDQLAIFEAIVFSDRSGDKPLSRITASATSADSPNGQYIQAALDARSTSFRRASGTVSSLPGKSARPTRGTRSRSKSQSFRRTGRVG